MTLALLLPAAAPAAERHVIRGAGFGHGIGFSQFGGKGLAEHGRGYREIIAHYYRGTEIGRAADRPVRVLLQASRREVRFSQATRASGRRLDPDRTYRARARGFSGIELRTAGGRLVGVFDAPLRVTSSAGIVRLRGTTINGVREGLFREVLEIRPGVFGGLGAVNALSIDSYVKGVVPGEVPALWHMELLKAQALAARSYALATNRGGGVFDQYPDTRSQVYRGYSGEHPRTNLAVDETAGEVITYRGEVIRAAYYFSTSGGRTENVENVFYNATPVPYLTSVEDPYDSGSPRHRWRFSYSRRQMQAKLSGLVKGRFRRVKVIRRGASPRIVWAQVIGTRGRTRVRGATLRFKLGLHDTWAYFTRVRTSSARRAHAAGPLARSLHGSFVPRPRSGRLVVERRTRSGWRRVTAARVSRSGAYRVRVSPRATYRVRSGATAGPAVRVR